MEKLLTSETMIENLVSVAYPSRASAREKHVYRETLRSLVRLAKSEQLVTMKKDVERLAGAIIARRKTRAVLSAERLATSFMQQQLEFPHS